MDATEPGEGVGAVAGLQSLGAVFTATTQRGQQVLLVIAASTLAVVKADAPHEVEVIPLDEVRRFEVDDRRLTLWRPSGKYALTLEDPTAVAEDLISIGMTVAGASGTSPMSHAPQGRAEREHLELLANAPEADRVTLLAAPASSDGEAAVGWVEQQRFAKHQAASRRVLVVNSPDYPGRAVSAILGHVSACSTTRREPRHDGALVSGVEDATAAAVDQLRMRAVELGADTVVGLQASVTALDEEILVQVLGTAIGTLPMQPAAISGGEGGGLRVGPDRITTLPGLPGQTILRILGLVTSLQAASGFTAGMKGREALDKVMADLGGQARSLGANAVVGVSASSFGAGGGITNALGGDAVGILLVGTAVIVQATSER